jgi:hypothetical protein
VQFDRLQLVPSVLNRQEIAVIFQLLLHWLDELASRPFNRMLDSLVTVFHIQTHATAGLETHDLSCSGACMVLQVAGGMHARSACIAWQTVLNHIMNWIDGSTSCKSHIYTLCPYRVDIDSLGHPSSKLPCTTSTTLENQVASNLPV